MSAPRQPLVPSGHLKDSHQPQPPLTYISQTPPTIHPHSYILAAVSTRVSELSDNDWFLSDFYAFNYLFHGLGSGQKWLTVAEPRDILKKTAELYGKSYGDILLHGNPYQDRRVVLSEDLIAADQLTKPIVVKPGNMRERFLQEAKSASEAARKKNVPLVMLAFCHGVPNQHLILDGTKNDGLSATVLKGYLELGTQVTLITTACYSGGWVINPDFRDTVMAAANPTEESIAWTASDSLGRTCGSIFVSSFIQNLTGTTSPLIEQGKEGGGSVMAWQGGRRRHISSELQPELPNEQQTSTYNAFCHAVWDSCKSLTRLHTYHSFSFSAKNDQWDHSWTGLTGILVQDYEEKWNKLKIVKYRGTESKKLNADQDPSNSSFLPMAPNAPTGGLRFNEELIKQMCQHDIQRMARIFLDHACPGDWVKGKNVGYGKILRACAEGKRANTVPRPDPNSDYQQIEILASIQYRWNLSLFCDSIIKSHNLPVPSGKGCLFWHDWDWQDDIGKRIPSWKERSEKITTKLFDGGFLLIPCSGQGPEMARSLHYVAAAIVEANWPEEKTMKVVDQVLLCMRQFEEFEQRRLMAGLIKDPRVWEKGRDWFKSVGKHICRHGT
ncbi:hypothetical protein F4678DRAFT_453118 [Xylaria arbuscula]|nr:hypothetical protein F4678DRAFT_453118 [Xylaria arbuscula]